MANTCDLCGRRADELYTDPYGRETCTHPRCTAARKGAWKVRQAECFGGTGEVIHGIHNRHRR